MRTLIRLATGAATVIAVVVATASPASATEYGAALKIRGVQYDAPGSDSNSCSTGNTDEEYVTIKNYSPTKTVNLNGYVVRDKTGNQFEFTNDHFLQPGDYVKLRGGNGTDSDKGNVVYRNNCNFIWNNGGDTIYLFKSNGDHADTHSYTPSGSDPDGNGYVKFHS